MDHNFPVPNLWFITRWLLALYHEEEDRCELRLRIDSPNGDCTFCATGLGANILTEETDRFEWAAKKDGAAFLCEFDEPPARYRTNLSSKWAKKVYGWDLIPSPIMVASVIDEYAPEHTERMLGFNKKKLGKLVELLNDLGVGFRQMALIMRDVYRSMGMADPQGIFVRDQDELLTSIPKDKRAFDPACHIPHDLTQESARS